MYANHFGSFAIPKSKSGDITISNNMDIVDKIVKMVIQIIKINAVIAEK